MDKNMYANSSYLNITGVKLPIEVDICMYANVSYLDITGVKPPIVYSPKYSLPLGCAITMTCGLIGEVNEQTP